MLIWEVMELMAGVVIYLDDGGVLNDNSVRGPQWRRLAGEYMAPRLGGAPEAWAEANARFAAGLFAGGAWEARLNAAANYADFERTYYLDWVRGMCNMTGVEPPPDEEAIKLGLEAELWIIARIKSGFPGAAEAARDLHSRGYALHTSSGSSSRSMHFYLETMDARPYFSRLYGPDLVDTFKAGPLFYERIFADSAVAPAEALVLDDNPEVIGWASEVGARTLLVGSGPAPQVRGCVGAIGTLAELPGIIEDIGPPA
jgi:phosphoglycolate phosphatase-like HAD superfamily hydrolase